MNLLQLYHSILVQVYTDWINDVDLSCLDAAVCSSKLRYHFLQAIKLSRLSLNRNDSNECMLGKYEWMMRRCIGIKKCMLDNKSSSLFESVFDRTSYLEHFTCNTISDIKLAQNKSMYSLKCLFWERFPVEDFLQVVNGVVNLDLSDCLYSSESICPLIVRLFPYLKVFKCRFHGLEVLQGCAELEEVEVLYSPENVKAIIKLTKMHSISFMALYTDTVVNSADIFSIAHNFPHLRRFSCGNCCLTEYQLLDFVSTCPHLECLELLHYDISDVSVLHVANHCRRLKTFLVSSSFSIDDGILSLVERCPLLTSLTVYGLRSITETTIEAVLRGTTRLARLEVRACPILERAFELCPSLEYLMLDDAPFSVSGFLSNLSEMEYLSINSSNIKFKQSLRIALMQEMYWNGEIESIAFLDGIERCTRLKEIHLMHLYYATEDWIVAVVDRCPLLTSITIQSVGIRHECIGMLARCSLDLQKLSITDMSNITVGEVAELVACRKGIRCLSLVGCTGCTKDVIAVIGRECTDIESLVLTSFRLPFSECTEEVSLVLKNCPKLSYLKINGVMTTSVVVSAVVETSRKTSVCDVSDKGCEIKFSHFL